VPHIHIKEFKTINYPQEQNGVTFHFQADNILHDDEKLIATTIDDKNFFIMIKDEKERSLVKSDKLTRVSPNYYTKRAIKEFALVSNLEVTASNIENDEKHIHFNEENSLKSINFFATSFPKIDDLRIEVGFGSGRHLLHQAQNNPDIFFIGIEIHKPSIEQALKHISIMGLKNVMLLDYDARLFMELVPSNIVSRVYVHFPVPWDKKPQRRVINQNFITESLRVLNIKGELQLRTDSENYYAYSFETFTSLNKLSLKLNKNHDISISSKYEDRWKKMEKNIYDLTLVCDEKSPEQSSRQNFEFKLATIDLDHIKSLNTKTLKFDGGFIHFERLYSTSHNKLLLRVSMGSFDRPEHLYILLDENEAQYYPNQPIQSRTNAHVHQKLIEALQVN
jgi:tRNA (guanine-N7-)-methyltransferase